METEFAPDAARPDGRGSGERPCDRHRDGPGQPLLQPGRTITTAATLLSTSLHMRSFAFDMAFQDRGVVRMLTELRDLGRVGEVFAAAATAPLDPGIGDMPRFLPEFRDALRPVFRDGDILALDRFEDVRARAWPGVPGFDPAA